MPEARQNKSKLAEMFERASSFSALVGMAVDVVSLFMALLSSVESAPRAYRLKASNAATPISTSTGTIPCSRQYWIKFADAVEYMGNHHFQSQCFGVESTNVFYIRHRELRLLA